MKNIVIERMTDSLHRSICKFPDRVSFHYSKHLYKENGT